MLHDVMPHAYYLAACFIGGLALMNAMPHLVSGVMGRRFPSPFAKPPGKGQSSAIVNVTWGFANLVGAYLIIGQVPDLDLRDLDYAGSLVAGALLNGVFLARSFSRLNEGRGPDLS